MRFPRSSGVLLHPTSLPGRFGVGDLGPEAYRFVDFLAEAGQSFWQVMPLGPSGLGDSPYASTSAFAGNVNVVSPEALRDAGLLTEPDLRDAPGFPAERVDFGAVIGYKRRLLEQAFQRWKALMAREPARRAPYEAALAPEAGWLPDYALFAALHEEHGGAAWPSWKGGLADRDPAALAGGARGALAERVEEPMRWEWGWMRRRRRPCVCVCAAVLRLTWFSWSC